jgi:hypothetical protein
VFCSVLFLSRSPPWDRPTSFPPPMRIAMANIDQHAIDETILLAFSTHTTRFLA